VCRSWRKSGAGRRKKPVGPTSINRISSGEDGGEEEFHRTIVKDNAAAIDVIIKK